jgi:hypothetical protein
MSPRGRISEDDVFANAGAWLRKHSQPTDTLVAYEIGKIAYVSGLATTDLLGLTEPRARIHLRERDFAWAIRELPTYVFSNENPGSWPLTDAIFRSAAFARHYRPAARFAFRANTDYVIYRRADKEAPSEADEGGSGVRWVDVYHPTRIARGVTAAYSLTVMNVSGDAWRSDGPAAVSLGYQWLDGQADRVAVQELRTTLPYQVEPGERVLVSARLRAPDRPGNYALVWTLSRTRHQVVGERLSTTTSATVAVE